MFKLMDKKKLQFYAEEFHEILVLITYVKSNSLNMHMQPSSEARCLNFDSSLYLHTFFVCVSREGSDKTDGLCRLF